MAVTQVKVQQILEILRNLYPGWNSFSHASFAYEEVTYKQDTIAKARELLSESEFSRLLQAGEFGEIVTRLEAIGRDNNLLWINIPTSGDLSILYQPGLDRATFCQAVFDLLYGPGASPARLERYVAYVIDHGLPNKWTFPTYYLFMAHPDTEMFIKPSPISHFLDFMESGTSYSSTPTAETYRAILELVAEVRTAFKEFDPRDNVDIQGLIWACYQHTRWGERELVAPEKREEFAKLFAEFLSTYPDTPQGQAHLALYSAAREAGIANWQSITASANQGQDVTDDVLLKLLPYADTSVNRSQGAWVHWAPTINGDLRRWFEQAGWTKPADWPLVAAAILDFVQRCVEDPAQLAEVVASFAALPYSKGFQTGMLTPILNALRPDAFVLINNKSRALVNYFAGQTFAQSLTDYPSTNLAAQALVSEFTDLMHQPGAPPLEDSDLFDMFSHWLVAVKHHSFRNARYWKIAPGDNAWQWDECRLGGFIAVGWEELGDLSGVSHSEYLQRRDPLCAEHGWAKSGVDQVWTFVSKIKEGDRIVANRGKKEILGVGTVVGPYYFVPGVRHGHRLPVEWVDTTLRSVDEYGWQRTVVELDRAKYESILQLPGTETIESKAPGEVGPGSGSQESGQLAVPFSDIFDNWEQANWAFDFLADAARRLGASEPADERFAFTVPVVHRQRLLRLNFCGWVAVDIDRTNPSRELQIGIALLSERFAQLGLPATKWEAFKQREGVPAVSVHVVPASALRDDDGRLHEVFQQSMVYIAEVFKNWRVGKWRFAHRQKLFDALFDQQYRHQLFREGLVGKESTSSADAVNEDAAFSPLAFELLAELHAKPTKHFYQEHKEEFKGEVEEPFARLLKQVAVQLPEPILEVMETEKRVVSRFLKNDFGQGGAWDFYWGAFYPKDGKRTEDAQLSLWINHERLEIGFYIGDYGSAQRQRFQRNCRDHRAALSRLLGKTFGDANFVFGNRENYQIDADGTITAKVDHSWDDFLGDRGRLDNDVSTILPRDQVLRMSASELASQIAQGFSLLYPLVLLALHDNPMPALAEYLEGVEPIDEHGAGLAPSYPLDQFAAQAGFDEATLARWVRAIQRKGQAVLYGPPGTGKTFVAEQLARHLIGGGDGFWDLVQFHPAYAYEDFIQGIRPQPQDGGGLTYPVVPGRFLQFCRQAGQRKGTCVLIIDEINRANLARVFGELMYLLEYRDHEIPLAGGGVLRIPGNVRIIGTMNTADRSIALVDHALRRRFAFLALYPDYNVLRRFHEREDTRFQVDGLIKVLEQLNRTINDRHYEVGISYFLRRDLAEQVADIWTMEIEPYLEEYFFDQPDKVDNFRWTRVQGTIRP